MGDVKYKRVNAQGIKHPDLYQLLAYAVAANLESGFVDLRCRRGRAGAARYPVSPQDAHIETLTLAGSIDAIRGQINRLAERVRALADAGDGLRDQLRDGPALAPQAGS